MALSRTTALSHRRYIRSNMQRRPDFPHSQGWCSCNLAINQCNPEKQQLYILLIVCLTQNWWETGIFGSSTVNWVSVRVPESCQNGIIMRWGQGSNVNRKWDWVSAKQLQSLCFYVMCYISRLLGGSGRWQGESSVRLPARARLQLHPENGFIGSERTIHLAPTVIILTYSLPYFREPENECTMT